VRHGDLLWRCNVTEEEMITLNHMLALVRVLSNSCFVRWWAHWNYPQTHPWEIAFCAIDFDGSAVEVYEPDLPEHKKEVNEDGRVFYIFTRSDVGFLGDISLCDEDCPQGLVS